MALDVHISPDRQNAEWAYPRFGLGITGHALLVRAIDRAATPMTLMSRIRDYYADAEFQAGELDDLTAELRMLERHESNEEVLKVIRGLIEVCQEASQEKASLYFFCD